MNTKRVVIVVGLFAAVTLPATYFASPRSVIVDTRDGIPAGIRISILEDTSGVHTVSTDSRGVATFGRGPWSPLFGKQKFVSLKVERDGKTSLDGLVDAPRWGAIRIAIP